MHSPPPIIAANKGSNGFCLLQMKRLASSKPLFPLSRPKSTRTHTHTNRPRPRKISRLCRLFPPWPTQAFLRESFGCTLQYPGHPHSSRSYCCRHIHRLLRCWPAWGAAMEEAREVEYFYFTRLNRKQQQIKGLSVEYYYSTFLNSSQKRERERESLYTAISQKARIRFYFSLYQPGTINSRA